MKVCQVTPYYSNKGGISSVVRNLSRSLIENNIDLTVISPDVDNTDKKTFTVSKNGIKKTLGVFNNLKLVSPEIVHVHAHGTLLIGVLIYKYLSNRKVKIVMTMHTQPTDKSYIHNKNYIKRSKPRNFLFNLMLKKVNKIVFVSKSLLEDYKKYMGVTAINTIVINNGVTVKKVNESDINKFKQRYKIDDKNDSIVISMLSGLQWDLKVLGVAKLIECFNIISKDSIKKMKLYIAGDGMYRDYIEGIIKETKNANVVLLGEIGEVRELLAITDIYAHISPMDTCSVAILEAMSMKKNIVSVNRGGNGEVIVNEVNGLLVDFEEKEICEALNYMCENLDNTSFAENAYNDAITKFSMENVVTQYINLYNSL